VIHALLWATVFNSVFAVANLIPLRLRERRGGPAFSTDGMIVLSALAMMFTGRSRRTGLPASQAPAATAGSTGQARPEPSEIGVRVWRHRDHLHIGVGTKHALETGTAATTTMSPATARGLGRAILDLADEAEHTGPARLVATDPESRSANAASGSVAPPGYSH
jgi:hypothetical protein